MEKKEVLDKKILLLLLTFTVILGIGTTLMFVEAASDTGTIGVEITEITEVNFTIASLDWGAGSVNSGENNATLDSYTGTVTGGSWTTNDGNLTLENIGSEKVILNLSSNIDADSFVGGSSIINSFQWMMSEVESGSCNTAGATNLSSYVEINTNEINVCSEFKAIDTTDSIGFDFKIVIPSDTNKSGAQSATITAIATEIVD